MRLPSRRLLALLVLTGPACAKLIGLPDLPEVSSAGAKNTGGASGMGIGGRGGTAGSGGVATGGGGSSSADAGEMNGGAGTQGGSAAGSANVGGASSSGRGGAAGTGGSRGGAGGSSGGRGGVAGSGGSDVCEPACGALEKCEAGGCVCEEGLTPCYGICVNLQTDPDHCGTCLKTCEDGCSVGRCFADVLPRGGGIGEFAINATDIYFTVVNEDSVYRVPRGGGAVTTLAEDQVNASAIVLDTANVYWLNEGNDNNGEVMKLALSGGEPEALVTGEPSPQFIAVGPTDIYFAEYPNGLFKVPIAGGAMVDVTTGTDVSEVRNLLTDEDNLYWTTSANGGSILKIPHGGAAVDRESLGDGISGSFNPGFTTLSGSFLYFQQGTQVGQLSINGGVVKPVADVEGSIVTADGSGIYLVDNKNLTIVKISPDGNTVTPLAKEVTDQIYRIVVSGEDLFWWSSGGALRVTSKTP